MTLRREVVTDLQREGDRLRVENRMLVEEKSRLQTELLHASDYILQLEEKSHQANVNSLTILK